MSVSPQISLCMAWPGLAVSAAINFVIFSLAIRGESWLQCSGGPDGSDERQSDQFCVSWTVSGGHRWSHWSVIRHCVKKYPSSDSRHNVGICSAIKDLFMLIV